MDIPAHHAKKVPVGVGPMSNMQRGKARDTFRAGIAADGDGGVSRFLVFRDNPVLFH